MSHEKFGSKVDVWSKNRGLKLGVKTFSGTLKNEGLKSIFFPCALKKGVYTAEPTHHLQRMSTPPPDHSGLQQSARPHIRVSAGDEKWSDSEMGKVIDGNDTTVSVYFLHQNAVTTHETGTQARI